MSQNGDIGPLNGHYVKVQKSVNARFQVVRAFGNKIAYSLNKFSLNYNC